MITVFACRAAGAAADRRDATANGRINLVKKVAVIAHAGKTIGGGLDELRATLEKAGVRDPIWSEVPKSKYAPERVDRVLAEGAELVFVWGGDGMVQRSIDRLAGSGARWRSSRPERRTCSPRVSRSHPISRRQSRSASTAAIASSTSGRSTASGSP